MSKEALKLALELKNSASAYWTENEISIIEKLIELLAQPKQEQEPVCPDCKAKVLYECVACSSNNYPPQHTWVDLTPQDLNDIFKISHTGEGAVYLALKIIKDKNA